MSSDSSDDDPQQIPHLLRNLDLLEMESSFVIKLDAPGVEFKDITIEFNTGINTDEFKDESMLIISVERRLDPVHSNLGLTTLLAEREYGRFSRKIFLPEGVNIHVFPTYSTTNGVITVTVEKLTQYDDDELSSSVYPRTDTVVFPDKLVYLMDLPGLVKEKVKVEIVELTSRGPSSLPALRITSKWERDFEGGILWCGSRLSHSFRRAYILPRDFEGARTENIQLEMKDGVLTVCVPKTTTHACMPSSEI